MNISKDLIALALRNVSRHKARSCMTLASIVFGVVSLILAGGFIEDTIIEVGESMIHSYSGHIQVAEKGYFQFGSQRPAVLVVTVAQIKSRLGGIASRKRRIDAIELQRSG